MDIEIADHDAFALLGYPESFGPGHHDYAGIWKRRMAYHDQLLALSLDGAHYGTES